jgi:hypothetical protein
MRPICSLARGSSGGRAAGRALAAGDLEPLRTKRSEMCEQEEHLNVWRSRPAIRASARLTCTRRISAPHAKHRIVLAPPRDNPGPHGAPRRLIGVKVWAERVEGPLA